MLDVLSRQLEARLGIDAFDAEVVRARSTSAGDPFRHGLLTVSTRWALLRAQ